MGARPRVMVTRPEPGASRTARALQAAGYEPVIVPLTEIVALPVDPAAVDRATGADLVLATSMNAIRHAPGALLAALRDRPLWAVGDATAQAAQETGFGDVRSVDGDAATLAETVLERTPASARLAYLCGAVRLSALEDALATNGRDVIPIETYTAKKVSHMTDKWRDVAATGPIDAVLLHSAVSAQCLAEATEPQDIENAVIIAMSERVAAALPDHERQRAVVARRPRDDAMLAALTRHRPAT